MKWVHKFLDVVFLSGPLAQKVQTISHLITIVFFIAGCLPTSNSPSNPDPETKSEVSDLKHPKEEPTNKIILWPEDSEPTYPAVNAEELEAQMLPSPSDLKTYDDFFGIDSCSTGICPLKPGTTCTETECLQSQMCSQRTSKCGGDKPCGVLASLSIGYVESCASCTDAEKLVNKTKIGYESNFGGTRKDLTIYSTVSTIPIRALWKVRSINFESFASADSKVECKLERVVDGIATQVAIGCEGDIALTHPYNTTNRKETFRVMVKDSRAKEVSDPAAEYVNKAMVNVNSQPPPTLTFGTAIYAEKTINTNLLLNSSEPPSGDFKYTVRDPNGALTYSCDGMYAATNKCKPLWTPITVADGSTINVKFIGNFLEWDAYPPSCDRTNPECTFQVSGANTGVGAEVDTLCHPTMFKTQSFTVNLSVNGGSSHSLNLTRATLKNSNRFAYPSPRSWESEPFTLLSNWGASSAKAFIICGLNTDPGTAQNGNTATLKYYRRLFLELSNFPTQPIGPPPLNFPPLPMGASIPTSTQPFEICFNYACSSPARVTAEIIAN